MITIGRDGSQLLNKRYRKYPTKELNFKNESSYVSLTPKRNNMGKGRCLVGKNKKATHSSKIGRTCVFVIFKILSLGQGIETSNRCLHYDSSTE